MTTFETTWQKTLLILAFGAAILGPLATAAAAQPCNTAYNNSNGPKSLYLNIHNCGTVCARQELPYLRLFGDGVTGVRVAPVPRDRTEAPQPEFYTVNGVDPYFDGLVELFGAENILMLIDDGVDEGPHAKPSPDDMLRLLTSALERHPEVRHIEFMNEPLNFSDITPEEYVHRYLRPARAVIDQYNADRGPENQIILYTAAWFGNADGIRQARRMIRAGALAVADVLTAHIYDRRVEDAAASARAYKRMARGTPVAVTETNFNTNNRSNYDAQGWWICESMTAMEEVFHRGLSPAEEGVQHNVLYTLRADAPRLFNLIGFPDKSRELFWQTTGPGHVVLQNRGQVPTDPKVPAAGNDAGSADVPANEPVNGPAETPAGERGPGRGRG